MHAIIAIELIQLHGHSDRKPQLLHTDNNILQVILFQVGFMYLLCLFWSDTAYLNQLLGMILNDVKGVLSKPVNDKPCCRLPDSLDEAA